MNTEYLRTLQNLDAFSIHYTVGLRAAEMMEVAENTFNPTNLPAMVEAINDVMPCDNFAQGNPNHGRPHHNFVFGKEHSRVLYLEVIKAYYGEVDYEQIVTRLEYLAAANLVDEFDVIESSPVELKVRFWWD